jgi:hypothetical protein
LLFVFSLFNILRLLFSFSSSIYYINFLILKNKRRFMR